MSVGSGQVLDGSDGLALAYSQCSDLARQTARNFYYSFLVLPRTKRLAMCALYAFMRRTDDIGDGPLSVEERHRALEQWRRTLDDTLAGRGTAELWWLALRDTVRQYGIDPQRLHEVIDGVASDLVKVRYATFDELYHYSYRVASAVGLACIRIWGANDPRSEKPAEWCGIAFQLTNVLRDLVEDFDRGRLYIPGEDLERFGVGEEVFANRQATPAFMDMMSFQIDRARSYYDRSQSLADHLPASGRAILQVMRQVYVGLLDRIERDPARVLAGRVTLPVSYKVGCLLQALPIRYWFDRLPSPPAH